jgi:hypothetical protein
MGACAVVLVHDPSVAALVYIAAFAPDKGESVATLTDLRPGASVSPVLSPQDGFRFQDRAKFPAWFGADIPAEQAEFMADSQVPWGVDALGGTVSEPAWRTKPSWYPVATDDRMIPRRPSGRWQSGRVRPWSRSQAATGSTSRYRNQWLGSSNRRAPRCRLRAEAGPRAVPWHGASRCRRLERCNPPGGSNGN